MCSLSATARAEVDNYWADFLDCEPQDFYRQQSTVVARPEQAGVVGFRRQSWVISTTTDLPMPFRRRLMTILESSDDAPAIEQAVVGCGRDYRLHNVYGPSVVHYLDPASRLYHPGLTSQLGLCELDFSDPAPVETFLAELGETREYRFDDPQTFPIAYAAFEDRRIIGLATVRVWNDLIGEVFVDVLPGTRSAGLGTRLAARVTRWIVHVAGLIPQYDTEVTNAASIQVARKLGFSPYAHLLVMQP